MENVISQPEPPKQHHGSMGWREIIRPSAFNQSQSTAYVSMIWLARDGSRRMHDNTRFTKTDHSQTPSTQAEYQLT